MAHRRRAQFASTWVAAPALFVLLLLVPLCGVEGWAQQSSSGQDTQQGDASPRQGGPQGRGEMRRGARGDGEAGQRGGMARRRAERQELMQFQVFERISRMAPEDREALLSRLPAERRQRVEANLRRLEAMPPERREMLTQRLRQFEEMTPERQDRLRALARQMVSMPPERRTALRAEFARLKQMPDEDRLDYTSSTGFQERFSGAERDLLLDLVETAPSPSLAPLPPRAPVPPAARRPGPGPRR